MCKKCFRGGTPLAGQKCLTQRLQERRIRDAQAFARLSIAAHVPGPNPSQHRPDKGQWAMAIAREHPERGIGGSGNLEPGTQRSRGKFSWAYLRIARVVLRQTPELADKVTDGSLTLTRAYRECKKFHPSDVDRVPEGEPFEHVEGTRGQRAMALAFRFPGYQSKGCDREARKYIASGGFSLRLFKLARWVLRRSPELAAAVRRGELSPSSARRRILGSARVFTGENATKLLCGLESLETRLLDSQHLSEENATKRELCSLNKRAAPG